MIRVHRTTKPAILIRNGTKWTDAIHNADTPEKKKKAIEKYKNPQIKKALQAMFAGKCAFCESIIMHIDFGDIEHFRPKSKYPLLAVSWDNLFLSCKRCNSAENKGDKFPVENEGGPLINPCEENPEHALDFEFDIQTRIAVIKGKTTRGETTINILGLNRHDLLLTRSRYVRHLMVLSQFYHEHTEARNLLDEACEKTGEYAAFARMIKQYYV